MRRSTASPCRPPHDSKSGPGAAKSWPRPGWSAGHPPARSPCTIPKHATGTAHREGSGRRCDDEQVTEHAASAAVTAEDEVATLCRDLIRIDTSNYGDHSGPGERPAAEHVAALLSDVGLEPVVLESHSGRASVVTRR